MLGVVVIVMLISWLHVHPFLALVFGSAALGIVGGLGPAGTIDSSSTAWAARSAASGF
ncbi:hypothetical protein [Pseudonocardia humida]|uniref:GntP family permease n=1 Tax=Pseudonocardia humida TaxID=2800819 RepID=A0ABT1A709_9PSEU|nr:hypothetical protein [Pseudonocardia humida]MCO1658731.1 hypothetical protein [Pseudonocardia humida]